MRKTSQPPDIEVVENENESVKRVDSDVAGDPVSPGEDTRCRRCGRTPPAEAPTRVVRDGRIKIVRPRGPMNGEMRGFIDQKTNECRWIECACAGGGDGGQERPVPLASFLGVLDAASYLGVRPATLYAWAPFLESADKRGSRLIFWTDALVNDDIPELENRIPHRAELESERLDRALGGEVLRAGRHANGCSKAHADGPCARRPNPNTRQGRSQKWLRDLGKDRKK